MGTVDMDLGKSGEDPTPPFSRSGPERSDDLDPLLRSAAPYVACNSQTIAVEHNNKTEENGN